MRKFTNRLFAVLLPAIFPLCLWAQNSLPVVSNLSVSVDTAARKVSIGFDLADADNQQLEVSLRVSGDGGKTFLIPVNDLVGDVGFPVEVGAGKQIVWTYELAELTMATDNRFLAKVVATDREPVDIQQIVDQVDSLNLKKDVRFLTESRRHRTSDAFHLSLTKEEILKRYENFLDPIHIEIDAFSYENNSYLAENLIGRKPGHLSEAETVIIDGHYDSVSNSPGADDNASAVAGYLEALRVLAPYEFEKSIKFIGFDLEEAGLEGAFNYVNKGQPEYEVNLGALNLEMIGYYSESPNTQNFPFGFDLLFPDQSAAVIQDQSRGNFITNVGNTPSTLLQNTFNAAAAQYVPDLKIISLNLDPSLYGVASDLLRSDHAAFWLGNQPALMLTDGSNFRNPYYHTPADTLGTLNFVFMHNVVKATVATAATMAVPLHCGKSVTTPFELNFVPTNRVSENKIGLDKQVITYPNPFSRAVNIQVDLEKTEVVSIRIFDNTGKQIALLTDEPVGPGKNTWVWNGNLQSNLPAPDGLYICTVHVGAQKVSKKLLLIPPHTHGHD